MVRGMLTAVKGWQCLLHIPLGLAPASNTTHPTSRTFLAGFVLLYLFGTSLINAQNSVYVQKLAWYKSLSPSEWEQ